MSSQNHELQRALESQKALLRQCVEYAPVPIAIFDRDMKYIMTSRRFLTDHKLTLQDLVGRSHYEVFPEIPERWKAVLQRCLAGATERAEEDSFVRADGRLEWVRWEIQPWYDESGAIGGIILFSEVITERKQAEVALQASETRLQHIVAANPAVIYVTTPDLIPVWVSHNIAEMLGFSAQECLIPTWWSDHLHPDDREQAIGTAQEIVSKGHGSHEYRFRAADGEYLWIHDELRLMRNAAGQPQEIVGAWMDVTQRKRAEEWRRESEEQFRQLAENIREVFWMTDLSKDRMLYVSPAYEEIWGRSIQSLYASPADWAEAIHPDDRIRVLEAARTKQATGAYDEVYRIARPDGTLRWIRDRAFPVRDSAGQVYRIAGIAEDITELKQLEQQFLLSQKLEAVGVLAGGIAHDFNNNLSAILGFSDLALDHLHPEDPLHRYIEQVKKAGEQSAALTRQLLAFSRKQLLQPKVLDLNTLIAGIQPMLRRLISEEVTLQTLLSPELGHVKADPGQLEQVVMNLVINARDAMPQGGTLTLETKNIEIVEPYACGPIAIGAGQYIRLTVIDNGCGIDAQAQTRIFEPFFTTKEVGKGTGLGLSTVYGIVKQSGGYICVHSEVGRGTTFEIYLPRIEASLDLTDQCEAPTPLRRGAATILLVDDDEMVRAIARDTLQAQGYTVLEALNGGGALLIAKRHQGPIDLLLTDVVMPYMNGPELARQLTAERPTTRVLYMSGYMDDALAPYGVLQPGIAFLAKPFTPDVLMHKAQEVLDAPRSL